jgi:hypothetical protein
MPVLYDSWDDLFLSKDANILIQVLSPFVQMLQETLSATLQTFLSTFEGLHQTATKGSRNKMFIDLEERALLNDYNSKMAKGTHDSELLQKINLMALQKGQLLWFETYRHSVYLPLFNFLADAYQLERSDSATFDESFSFSTVPTTLPSLSVTKSDSRGSRDIALKKKVMSSLTIVVLLQATLASQFSNCEINSFSLFRLYLMPKHHHLTILLQHCVS